MPLVTSIKPQRNGKRLNIYLDDKFGFGVDLLTYTKRQLKVGSEITEEEVGSIVKESEFQKTYENILRFAVMRPRSEKEIDLWFKKKKIHSSLIKEITERLVRMELLDDTKFALWWVEQRNLFKPKPKRVIISELKIKGVNDAVIRQVLETVKIDEKGALKKTLTKALKRWGVMDDFEKRKRAYGYLLGKGFDIELIRDAISEI